MTLLLSLYLFLDPLVFSLHVPPPLLPSTHSIRLHSLCLPSETLTPPFPFSHSDQKGFFFYYYFHHYHYYYDHYYNKIKYKRTPTNNSPTLFLVQVRPLFLFPPPLPVFHLPITRSPGSCGHALSSGHWSPTHSLGPPTHVVNAAPVVLLQCVTA